MSETTIGETVDESGAGGVLPEAVSPVVASPVVASQGASQAAAPARAKKSYGPKRPKVPPFARYEGTSAWVKDKRRVRAYAMFKAAAKAAQPAG